MDHIFKGGEQSWRMGFVCVRANLIARVNDLVQWALVLSSGHLATQNTKRPIPPKASELALTFERRSAKLRDPRPQLQRHQWRGRKYVPRYPISKI